MPEHIKDGRFGNFLESPTSTGRFLARTLLGYPTPSMGQCEQTRLPGSGGVSYDQLLAKPDVQGMADVWEQAKAADPELPDDLRVHKPYIDAITYASPQVSRLADAAESPKSSIAGTTRGAMPFAQWGYPHQECNRRLTEQFPADFISEAIDQTRGWFYSLLGDQHARL